MRQNRPAMAYASLRDYVDRLEREGRLVRVSAPVSTNLEMTEIQTRLLAEGGPAVLFENAVGPERVPYDIPVLANLFGTVERVAWGMDKTWEPATDSNASSELYAQWKKAVTRTFDWVD